MVQLSKKNSLKFNRVKTKSHPLQQPPNSDLSSCNQIKRMFVEVRAIPRRCVPWTMLHERVFSSTQWPKVRGGTRLHWRDPFHREETQTDDTWSKRTNNLVICPRSGGKDYYGDPQRELCSVINRDFVIFLSDFSCQFDLLWHTFIGKTQTMNYFCCYTRKNLK